MLQMETRNKLVNVAFNRGLTFLEKTVPMPQDKLLAGMRGETLSEDDVNLIEKWVLERVS